MRPRSVAQNSALALAGDLASKAGMLAVMMVAARGLPTAEFAVFATAIAAATVLTAALDAGSQTLLTRDGVGGRRVRGGLLRSLTVARLPLLIGCAAGAVVVGAALGRPLEAIATVLIAAAGAAQLSITGALRSAQNLAPEAVAKLATGVLELAAAAVGVVLAPRAAVMLVALAVAMVLALVPLFAATRREIELVPGPRARTALRSAAPLGVMALAVLAYYRSGTIGLSILSTSAQTARFATASTIAWGMLAIGNAVTTGLLPRLAVSDSPEDLAAITRRALVWLTASSTLFAVAVAVLAVPLLTLVFGARYAPAASTLRLLALATAVIAPAGVLGTALVAQHRLRPVGVQIATSLTLNLVVMALLAKPLGAPGAALATLACELVGLALLVRAWRTGSAQSARRLGRSAAPAGVPRSARGPFVPGASPAEAPR